MPDSYSPRVQARVRFEEMYRAHGGAVRAFVHRRVPAASADDVVSEVFVAAWRRLEEMPDDQLPWLYGIARGLVANRRRGDARRAALQERLIATAVPDVDAGPAGAAEPRPLLDALSSLSERDQELLRLVAWEGLDRARAARALGISPSLCSLRLHRARRRLARALAADDGAPPQIDISMEVSR